MEADGQDALIRATVAGDKQAWQALVTAIAPRIEAIARSHEGLRSRGLAAQPDDVKSHGENRQQGQKLEEAGLLIAKKVLEQYTVGTE